MKTRLLDTQTGEYTTEYELEQDRITKNGYLESIIELSMHILARKGRKVSLSMKKWLFEKIREEEIAMPSYCRVVAGIEFTLDDEQEFDIIFKY